MFNLIPREVRFFDLFDRQSEHIIKAAGVLHELVHHFADARAKAHAIKEIEHQGDLITHEIVKRLNTTFITPIDREDIHALATRLDDVLDYIEAAAERLVVYRIKQPTSACRAMAQQLSTGGRRADSITTPRVGMRTPMRMAGSVPHPGSRRSVSVC